MAEARLARWIGGNKVHQDDILLPSLKCTHCSCLDVILLVANLDTVKAAFGEDSSHDCSIVLVNGDDADECPWYPGFDHGFGPVCNGVISAIVCPGVAVNLSPDQRKL